MKIMKSNLAIWSWILPIIGLTISFISLLITGENLGFGIYSTTISILVSTVLGLIFGIVALRIISQNSKITGKNHAIVGIVLNAILFIIFLLSFLLVFSLSR